MTFFNSFVDHPFLKEVMQDGERVFASKKIDIAQIDFEANPQFDEYEFYVHKVGFSLVNLVQLCDQLTYINYYISNFSYSKRQLESRPNRIDHLHYNIENYYIRYHSILDRLLQLINSVFHLCIEEKMVNYQNIMTNIRVSRTDISGSYKKVRNLINKQSDNRNQIVHRYSFREIELRKLQLFYVNYLDENNDEDKILKRFRIKRLTDYIKDKKDEFSSMNSEVFKLIPEILNVLRKEYIEQKYRLSRILGR
ncbi:MAG: Cthe_2314 family HEPN domain-containing protein [Carboxydocellales bacterium]